MPTSSSTACDDVRPGRVWLPVALWSAGILFVLGLAWIGATAYRLHRIEDVLVAEIAPRPGSLWFPDLRGAARKLGGPDRTLGGLRLYLRLGRPYRAEAIKLLAACGRPAVPDLIGYLPSPEIQDRVAAMTALREIGPDAVEALPDVVAIVRDAELPAERCFAISCLYHIGCGSPEAVSAMTAALHDRATEVVCHAAIELRRMGPASASAVPALAELLTHPEAGVREAAAAGLEGIGPQAASAVPALRAVLNDPAAEVRTQAAAALKRIDPGVACE